MSIELNKANLEAIKTRSNELADSILGLYFPVLDHGFVSLVDYCGGDFSIARSARTSYQHGVNQRTEDRNLIRYLLRHDHGTPFEFVQFTFHCQMPIFVARQWIRTRISSFNELSGRYSVMPLMFYTPEESSIQAQSANNKQGRDGGVTKESIDFFFYDSSEVRAQATGMYRSALAGDIARELARIDLPLSTYTNWYWSINLRSLMNFLRLRCDSHSQWEIRQYANVIAGMCQKVVPIAFEAWIDYESCAKKFSKLDLQLLDFYVKSNKTGTLQDITSSLEIEGQRLGLTKREIKEFLGNLFLNFEAPDFTLDLSRAKTPEYFKQEAENHVPRIEGK